MNMICRCGPRASMRATRVRMSDAAPKVRAAKSDPTGTLPLQQRFEREMNRRWDSLRKVIPSLINARTDAASTIEHAAITGQDPVRAFQSVFDKALKMTVVGSARGWMLPFVRNAGDLALARASDHVKSLTTDADFDDPLILDAAPQRDRIPPLQTLCHSELQGIAEAVSQQAVRVFTNGLMNRKSPGAIARDVQAIVDKTGKVRSSMLISFIVVRAFSAVTLDAFRAAGIATVGISPERISAPILTKDAKSKKKKTPDTANLVEVLTAGDDDVCPECEDISEQGPYTLDEAEKLIPAHPRCVLPGTIVEGSVIAAMRSQYTGPAIQIKTRDGSLLRVTINHPILTARGWIPAGEITSTDQIISKRRDVRSPVSSGVDSDDYRAPVEIEKVFDALWLRGFCSVKPTSNDLHGDARFVDGDIDIVFTDRRLLRNYETALAQGFSESVLEFTDVALGREVSGGASSTLFHGDDTTTRSVVGSTNLSGALVPIHLRPFEEFRIGSSSNWNIVKPESSFESSTTDSKFLFTFLQRHSTDVEFDEVLDVERFTYSGQVYDLQTKTGYMVAQGLVISNCRCAFVPWHDDRFASVRDSTTHTASGIMFMDPDGRALFVRRSSNGDHAGEWCFPGGAIEPGETAEQAARREAREEVGYDHIGTLEQIDRRTLEGVDFTTYLVEVPLAFTPTLDREHTTYAWNRLDDAPEPLHPGVRATIDRAVLGDDSSWNENLHPRDKDGKFAESGAGDALDVKSLTKVGEQKGSNAGGTYEDKDGTRFYVKSMDEAHAKNERLAASLYKLTEAPTLKYVNTKPDGDNHYVATQFESLYKDNVSKFSPEERAQAQKNFATHAWLANWDAAGTGGDNQGVSQGGTVKTLDVGGALEYRAKGAPKGAAFGTSVDEFNTLRDPQKNHDAANLFGDMTNEQIKSSVAKVAAIPDHAIKDAVLKGGGTEALADKLIARKNDLSARAAALGSAPVAATANAATAATDKTPHDYVKQVKGTSAERIEWRKQLKSATDPATKKELQNKVLASFKKQHDSTGSATKKQEIATNIAKYSSQYKIANPLTTAPVAAATSVATAGTVTNKPTFGKAEPTKTESSSYTPTPDVLPNKYTSYTQSDKQDYDDLVSLMSHGKPAPDKDAYKSASIRVDAADKRISGVNHDGTLTAVQAAHIVAYSGSQYRETNSALRAGKMTEILYRHTEALDTALSKLPGYVGTVYRKANLSSTQAMKYEPGHVVVEHAFTSTSKKEGVWSGDYRYVIEAKGRRGHDIEKLSGHGSSEAEVLYQSNSKFLVTKRDGNKIYMREL